LSNSHDVQEFLEPNEAKQLERNDLDPRWLVTSQLKAGGTDPTLLFEIIEDIIERRDWEWLPLGNGSKEPVGSFRRLIEAPPPVGCDLPADKLLTLLRLEHRAERNTKAVRERMAALRDTVRQLLDAELPPIATQGRPKRDDKVGITNFNERENDSTYALQRLKRDRPDIADKVVRGELSANAAAIEAGFRPRKVSINMEDAHSAARSLLRHMDAETLNELVHLLAQELAT